MQGETSVNVLNILNESELTTFLYWHSVFLTIAALCFCHADTLLGDDREISNYTTATPQTSKFPRKQLHSKRGAVFSTRSALRCYKQGKLVSYLVNVKDRPVLSSERAPHINKPVNARQKKIWS
jgi:hypothetical protein